MPYYKPGDFLNKQPTLLKAAVAYVGSPGSSRTLTIGAGTTLPPVDTFVHSTNGDPNTLYFGFIDPDRITDNGLNDPSLPDTSNNEYYLKYSDGLFDKGDLESQGLQSTDQKAANSADNPNSKVNQSWTDLAQKWGGWVLGVGAGAFVIGKVVQNRKQKA